MLQSKSSLKGRDNKARKRPIFKMLFIANKDLDKQEFVSSNLIIMILNTEAMGTIYLEVIRFFFATLRFYSDGVEIRLSKIINDT